MSPIRIFISYAREDSLVADRLYDTLSLHAQLHPWLDSKKLQPGDDWKRVILNQIDSSDYVLLLLSSHSVSKTGFVQREVREALERALTRPPGKQFILPVRVDECLSAHDELLQLHHLDLFPDWSIAIDRLCDFFGVKHYTHRYVAIGFSKTHTPSLVPVGDPIPDEVEAVQLVNAAMLPKISAALVPTEGMRREGAQKSIFIKLWTVASVDWPRTLYRKSDWNELDGILFASSRSDTQKQRLVELLIRQWSLAKELTPYDEDDWRALRKLIQEPTYTR